MYIAQIKVSLDIRSDELLCAVYRPFRAFIRAFRNWSAPLLPIFSIASEKRSFSEKNSNIFLGGHLPISIVKVLLQFDL